MRGRYSKDLRGSGLIVALGVLAMLAIVATTFITLTRLETRIATNYADEVRCELLAKGALQYFKALLRDDLDRTWGKYENRDTFVGGVGWQWSGNNLGRQVTVSVPGLRMKSVGTAISNDFWFNPPYKAWSDWGGLFLSEGDSPLFQQSFSGGTGWTSPYGMSIYSRGVVGRYRSGNVEADVWVGRSLAYWTDGGRGIVYEDHPDAGDAIDFDGDENPTPKDKGNTGAFYNEENSVRDLYYDSAPFVLFSGDSYYFPGSPLTGEQSLPRNVYWRWGVKLGVAQAGYLNMNTAGNLDGVDTAYMKNMGGIGLRASQVEDETENREQPGDVGPYVRYDSSIYWSGGYASLAGPPLEAHHLGRIHWLGFADDFAYQNDGGFPRYFDEVYYHPSQVSLEKVFYKGTFNKAYRRDGSEGSWIEYDVQQRVVRAKMEDLRIPRDLARDVVAYRVGTDGRAGDGSDRYRVGWRRDGATYYKFPSPEAPLADDRFFGANEVMEHDRSVSHRDTSAIVDILMSDSVREGREYWRRLRPWVTMWSTDTILRGKIWPTEGPPYTRTEGDWRHINVLKRVNINMIGASGREGLPDEDVELKRAWLKKRDLERERLYYMLVAGMTFTHTEDPEDKACQFIASLADMVDRDSFPTYYAAPDGSGAWALGVERQPVLNEIVLSARRANKADWEPAYLRFELYNPMENIPWIPDEQEELDIGLYRLKVNDHAWALSDLKVYSRDDMNRVEGDVGTIGADGLFGDPDDKTEKTLSRYLHVGWSADVPGEITVQEMIDGLTFSLWQPLGADADEVPNVPGKVEVVEGMKCVCVDRTDKLRLLPVNVTPGAPFSSYAAYTGMYRRWDPLNALLYEDKDERSGRDDNHYFRNDRELEDIRDDNRNNLVRCRGWSPPHAATLGRPNVKYPRYVTRKAPGGRERPQGQWKNKERSYWCYRRSYERNFKVVDGDLPSIGWLGELILWNAAKDGPITWIHREPQEPLYYRHGNSWYDGRSGTRGWADDLDYLAKFDLYRPFVPVKGDRKHIPSSTNTKPKNLHMLDIFTVWDPSNDGIDNDGDGAIDDEDTGCQPQDRGGPEVRVFGRLDLNLSPGVLVQVPFADGYYARQLSDKIFKRQFNVGRNNMRGYNDSWDHFGPVETIGDLLRADSKTARPGLWMTGDDWSWIKGPHGLDEAGFTRFDMGRNWEDESPDPDHWTGDDDGDGVFDERDERDMLFTWVANHLTTRSNVFHLDLVVGICSAPYYPEYDGEPRKLPMRAYKSAHNITHKQVLGILDRSTCLRILPDGRCEFTGPVDVRMLRFSDDKRVN